MNKKIQFPGGGLIILAGIFWGLMGLFVRSFTALGVSSAPVAFLRLGVGALIFALIILIKDKSLFCIKLRELPLFLALGICSLSFFTVCYFKSIEMMPLSTAAILLYTSPVWVMLMSALFFRERLTARKLCALGMAFGGCVLVSGLSGGTLSPVALLCGLGSGLGYALYSIIGTVALRRHEPLTVTFYGFLFGSLGCLVACGPGTLAAELAAAPLMKLVWLIPASALVSAVIPYLCYTQGLKSVEAGKASIIATVEPVVATLLGIVMYREPLGISAAKTPRNNFPGEFFSPAFSWALRYALTIQTHRRTWNAGNARTSRCKAGRHSVAGGGGYKGKPRSAPQKL